MPHRFVRSSDMRGQINGLLNDVEFKGFTLTITRLGRPAARLVPIDSDVNVADPTASLVPPPGAGLESTTGAEGKTPVKTPEKTSGKAPNPRKTR